MAKRIRVQIDLNPEEVEMLDKLKENSSSKTRSFLVAKALKFYQTFSDIRKDGQEIYTEKDGQKIRLLIID